MMQKKSNVNNFKFSKLEDTLVKLVPLKETDFDQLYQVASDPGIWEQHPNSDRYQRDVFRQYFEQSRSSGSPYLIIEQATGQLIGATCLYKLEPEHSQIAIGYTFLARQYWGRRYNRAVKILLINFIFDHVDKVVFHIGNQNIRSQNAILKLGALKTGEFYFEHNGRPSPHSEYLIKKEDWRKT